MELLGLNCDGISATIGETPTKYEANTSPKELFMGNTISKRIMGIEITVSTLVGIHLFPHIKFVCDPWIALMYNTVTLNQYVGFHCWNTVHQLM
jgi:hypothetical protein